MKRIFAALAALTVLTLGAAVARAAGPELSIAAPSGALRAGESFTVTVDLSGNPGIGSAQFTLSFDQDALSCEEAAVGGLLQSALSATNPAADTGAIIAAATADIIEGDGCLGTFRFTAKKDTSAPAFRLEKVHLTDKDDVELAWSLGRGTAGDSYETSGGGSSGGNGSSGGSSQTGGTAGGGASGTGEQGKTPPPIDGPEPPTVKPRPGSQPTETPESEAKPPENQAEAPAFSDVAGHWAESYIRRAASKGLLSGFADGSFRPAGQVTRGQMAVILWRLAGRPEPTAETPFQDLGGLSEEFRKAIAWGYGKGILNGVSDAAYAPGEGLSRQAAMKLLWGFYGGGSGPEALLYGVYDSTFTDSGDLAPWAKAPVYWGIYHGILTGTSDTTLSPRNGVNRAQLAAILTRCLDSFSA